MYMHYLDWKSMVGCCFKQETYRDPRFCVSDFYCEERVSGQIAWQLVQGLSDVRLERLRSESRSE